MAEQALRYPNNLGPSKQGSALTFHSGPTTVAPAANTTLKGGAGTVEEGVMSELDAIYAESEKINREILEQINLLKQRAMKAQAVPVAEAVAEAEANESEEAEEEEVADNDMETQEGGKSRRYRRRTTPRKKVNTGSKRHTRRHR
jgi:hypothetical protein